MTGLARLWSVWALVGLSGCVGEPGPGRIDSSGTAAPSTTVTTGSATTASSESETDEGESGSEAGITDLPGCDPLADPIEACGPMMRCDFETLTCVDASGTALVDEPCADLDACSPGLLCFQGFCADVCDVDDPDPDPAACDAGARVCAGEGGPAPGVCLAPCDLVGQNCSVSGQSCNRGVGLELELLAVCTGNGGLAAQNETCAIDEDCQEGYLCTPAETHTVACENDSARCCAEVCSDEGAVCLLSGEPTCYGLGIVGQESAGYCGTDQP